MLFVCLGNICRSPAAEGIARILAKNQGLSLKTDSAGTGAWHVGNPPDLRMQKTCAKRGTAIEDLRARQVQVEDFEKFDWILAMDRNNFADLKRLQSQAPAGAKAKVHMLLEFGNGLHKEVPDPYYGNSSDFEESWEIARHGVEAWLQHLLRETGR